MKPDSPPPDLLARLHDLEDQIPLSPAERRQRLEEAGFDVEAGLRDALDLIGREMASRARLALEKGREPRQAALLRLGVEVVHRAREASLARIRELVADWPAGEAMAFHRDYSTASEADLDRLVAELEALAAER